jgi:2-keto-3-deoxy-L-rhamnonate aldolase RhmA
MCAAAGFDFAFIDGEHGTEKPSNWNTMCGQQKALVCRPSSA